MKTEHNYWASVTESRLTRRRAIAGTAGAGVGALLLAACGGGSDSGGSSGGDANSLIVKAKDTTKQGKRGGTMKWYLNQEPAFFDVHLQHAPLVNFKGHVYRNLVQEPPGYMGPPEYKEVLPDIAQSWEQSADGLQLTMKLRRDVKWHNKAPVNGRQLDASDVIASWERFLKVGTVRGAYANSVNPDAPILSFTAPDPYTVVIKLAAPTSYLLAQLGHPGTGQYGLVPKETDNGFDIRRDMIGNGPFILDKYEPSVRMTFKRNPDWYEKDRPFVDQVDVPFILEYAQGLSQLKAGNIYTFAARAEDVLPTKRDVPSLNLYTVGLLPDWSGHTLAFGWQPAGQSPFRDERVRQAVSMSIDRDLYLETFGNVSKFEKEGIPVATRWNSALVNPSDYWYLDPKGKDFGPNAKYYKHNVAEAKSLLSAAGYATGFDTGSRFGAAFGVTESEVMDGMVQDIGIKPTRKVMDSATEYPQFRDTNGKWSDAWAYIVAGGLASEPLAFLLWRYTKGGGTGFLGFDTTGKGDGSGDPQVDALVKKGNLEMNTERRRDIIWELQRYLAKPQYSIVKPGQFAGLVLANPIMQNFMTYVVDRRGDPSYNVWLEEPKKPS